MTRIITLGEIMLRLSTSSGVRLEQSGHFAAHTMAVVKQMLLSL